MRLKSDPEHRCWRAEINHEAVAWAQVWGDFSEKNDRDGGQENGSRLQASLAFVIELLRRLGMDLIVKVEIGRRSRYSRWERSRDNELEYILPSARLFLLKSDGSVRTL
jgi:hypothetical protein